MSKSSDDEPTPNPPISISEMRERFLKLFTGAVNDVLRFKYKMHSSSLPAEFSPLRDGMKIAGQYAIRDWVMLHLQVDKDTQEAT